ncbi:DMT family transporter [Streptomyces sp. NPDC050560]|uniref:DMT family transporter n=1 Tax=Streptomyces sp. NPDC050560 TaxID=3365630 RepID=UPI00379DEF66
MPEARRTDVVLLLVALVWGSSYLAAKTASEAEPVTVVLFLRYLLSTAAGVALVLGSRRRGRPRWTRDEVRVGSVLGLSQAAVLALETYGVAHTTAANAGLLISLTLVITPLLDRAGGGRLPRRFFLTAGVCVVAVGLLTAGQGLHPPGVGDLLVLAAAVARAGHVALVGRFTRRRFSGGRALRPLRLTTVQTAVGTVLFLVPAAPGLPATPGAGGAVWFELAYLAVLCSLFAFLAQTWAVQRGSATRASLLLGTEPVWAVLVGLGLGGERLTPFTAAGACLMVVGTYWGQAIERSHRSRTTASGTPAARGGAADEGVADEGVAEEGAGAASRV